jgi:membrane protease YdiL (CAAX protease family)
LPSLLFAAMHMTGGMPWLAALCVVASCGLLYGTLMLATRSLPFVAAFHVANNLLQDAVLRPGEGSLFAPVFRAGPADAIEHSLQIWLSMFVLNAALAALAWRWRTPPPVRGADYAPATANPM